MLRSSQPQLEVEARLRTTRWFPQSLKCRFSRRPASINRALPINFVGGPDTVVDQIRRCREATGAGIIDLGFNTPGTTDPTAVLDALDLFGRAVLPRIRDI